MSKDYVTQIEGINVRANDQALIVTSNSTLRVLSSAVMNGGLRSARSIVNYHVPSSFKSSKPSLFLKRAIANLSLPPPTVGLMTVANLSNVSVKSSDNIVTLVTAGLARLLPADEKIKIDRTGHATINIIVIIDAHLTATAMVDAIKTVTESKMLVLDELDVRSRYYKDPVSGTITDSICLACVPKGNRFNYPGGATSLGTSLSELVKEGLEEAMLKQNKIFRNRPLAIRLRERGIKIEDMVQAGLELFVEPSPISKKECSRLLKNGIMNALSDPNISSLITAAIKVDEEGAKGMLYPLSYEAFMNDPITLVSDETIGAAIANYISGTIGVHNFLYYDRIKPGIIQKLTPFMDDAIGGLIAGVMSKILGKQG